VVSASYGFAQSPQDVLVAALVFALAFGFWLLRLIGAGDAKLLGACVLAVGFADAFEFTALLLGFSVLFLVFLLLASKALQLPITVSARLIEIAGRRRVPYGVPISLAAMTIMGVRLIDLARL